MLFSEDIPGLGVAALESIISSAMDAIITLDDQQRIVLFNRAAEVVFGTRSEDVLGGTLDRFVPGAAQEAHREHIRVFAHTGKTTRSMQSPARLMAVRADGQEFPIEATISMAEVDGRKFFTVVLRDTTERVKAEQTRNAFLAMMGHELRNPLQVLTSALYLAKTHAEGIPGLERPLGLLEKNLRHMVRLVDELLEVSRVTRGKLTIRKEKTSLKAILDRAVDLSHPVLEDSGHVLHRSIELDYGLHADVDRMAQAVSNLLDNAVKFSPRGTDIWLDAALVEDVLEIRVRDTGVGLEPQDLETIFEPFTQVNTRPGAVNGGLGVGLVLARAVVNLHGGSVHAESDGPGRGSTFVLRLPVPE